MANGEQNLPLIRLLRLASPALPVGAFGYSQGLETAVQLGWVGDEHALARWMADVLELNLSRMEAVLFCRLYRAWRANDGAAVRAANDELLAARETAELRAETVQMGYSLRAVFEATAEFDACDMDALRAVLSPAFATVFTFAVARWEIELSAALSGYLFAWAENQASAAVKTGRLGHVAAQRVLAGVAAEIAPMVERALTLEAGRLSNFAPALAIASCLHETQDSRLFRS